MRQVQEIIEKPVVLPSSYAITGLYFLGGSAPERARKIVPSERGELGITSLLESCLSDGILDVELMGRGYAWLDTGTHGSLLDAGNFVCTLSERQGQQVGCLEEIAWQKKWIDAAALQTQAAALSKSEYGAYLLRLLENT